MKPYRYRRPDVLEAIPKGRPAVIEASAGTGKTFTLEHLLVDLVLGGADIEQILVVTFTEKATREMRQRVRETLARIFRGSSDDPAFDPPSGSAWTIDAQAHRRLREALLRFDRAPIRTIHGFCQATLAEHPFHSGAPFAQELVDTRGLFGRSFRERVRRALAAGGPVAEALEAVGSLSQVEDQLYGWLTERGAPMPSPPPGDQPFALLVHELLPEAQRAMEADKQRTGQVDYDDLILRLHEAVTGAGGDALVQQLRNAYRYCLVDEFQDTDEAQWTIFRRLFLEDAGGFLIAIGDPKQAIYGFRGADVNAYLAAREIIAARGAVVPLTQNFRSTAEMIEAHNVLFEPMFQGAIGYTPIECGRPELAARDEHGEPAAPVTLMHLVTDANGATMNAEGVRTAMAELVAREVPRLVSGGLRFSRDGRVQPIRHSDIYVLVRNKREEKIVGEVLGRHGIPYAFFKQDGLFQTAEAAHIRDVLAAVADPDDRAQRLRAWLTPLFDVSLERVAELREVPESHPLVARLHRWNALADALDYPRLFRALLEETGLVRREAFLARSERALTNYMHVLEVLLDEVHRQRRSLPEVVAELDALIHKRAFPAGEDANVQRLESERDAVQVLTMHKAKGLEAPVVFVAGGITGRSSNDRRKPRICHEDGRREAWLMEAAGKDDKKRIDGALKREEQAEDLRLLYVALTRAKARVYVPYFGEPPDGRDRPGLTWKYRALGGCAKLLSERLRSLVKDGTVARRRDLFDVVTVPVLAESHRASGEPSERPRWVPSAGALELPPDPSRHYAALRASHAGPIVTSYTRMKAAVGGYVPPELETEAFTAEAHDLALPDDAREGLPGGSSVGVFLHEVLEELSFEAVRAAPDLEAWSADPEARASFESAARRNGVAPGHLPEARRLIFESLRVPVSAGGLSLADGLCAVERRVAEMRFHYPIPERAHPSLDAPRPAPGSPAEPFPFEVGRGYVRGVVDLVFEHGGRVCFLDWKSDRLPVWSAGAVAQHVERNYALQAKLYALGVVRMLDLHDAAAYEERFGGLLYCFLRGMPGGAGVYFERPPFEEVVAWEDALREQPTPFGYRLGGGAP